MKKKKRKDSTGLILYRIKAKNRTFSFPYSWVFFILDGGLVFLSLSIAKKNREKKVVQGCLPKKIFSSFLGIRHNINNMTNLGLGNSLYSLPITPFENDDTTLKFEFER